ncbi:MAG TPA: hypothetical protein VEA38_13345, partial [Terriglobales bacterium]|nr:hypothetical protein [Terriglobales bacterium]
LAEATGFGSATDAKRRVVQAVARVAEELGNTPAVCRKGYIHPAVIETYLRGGLPPRLGVRLVRRACEAGLALRPEERAVLRLLGGGARVRPARAA